MSNGFSLLVCPVQDVAKAKALYSTLLGTEPYADAPYYVGFRVGDQELGLDPNGHKSGLSAPLAYYEVDDINAKLQTLSASGAEVLMPVTNVGGGKLIARIKDPDGNIVGLMQNPA
jgi:predicted enzyme related to lactoylglutathione lyase